MTTDNFQTSVARIAASLSVSEYSNDGKWSRWTLVQNPASQDHYTCSQTWVVHGPCSLVVTGDMGTMVFERSGGISLDFARGGLGYVAEKCAAGEPWDYGADQARRDLVQILQDELDDAEDVDDLHRLIDLAEDAEEIDFDDDRAVHEWYYKNISCDDIPHLGQVPSSGLTRALACIKTVRDYEAVIVSGDS